MSISFPGSSGGQRSISLYNKDTFGNVDSETNLKKGPFGHETGQSENGKNMYDMLNMVMNRYAGAYCRYVLESGTDGDYKKYTNALKDMSTLQKDLEEMAFNLASEDMDLASKETYLQIMVNYQTKIGNLKFLLKETSEGQIRAHAAIFADESSRQRSGAGITTQESIEKIKSWYGAFAEVHNELAAMVDQTIVAIEQFIKILQYLFGSAQNAALLQQQYDASERYNQIQFQVTVKTSEIEHLYTDSATAYADRDTAIEQFRAHMAEVAAGTEIINNVSAGIMLDLLTTQEAATAHSNAINAGFVELARLKTVHDEAKAQLDAASINAGEINIHSARHMRDLITNYNNYQSQLLIYDPADYDKAINGVAKELTTETRNSLLKDWELYRDIHRLFRDLKQNYWVYFK